VIKLPRAVAGKALDLSADFTLENAAMACFRFAWMIGLFTIVLSGRAGSAPLADDPAAQLLASRGLKKVNSVYILPAEADVQKKVSEARLASRQLSFAIAQQNAMDQGADGRKALLQELLQEQISISEQMAQVDQQMNAMGPAGGNFNVAYARNQLVSQHNQLVAALEITTNRIQLLKQEDSDPRSAQKMGAEVAQRREGFLQTVLDLRTMVDKITAQYAELAGDPSVKKALSDLAAATKNAPKLGPSRGFEENVKLLVKTEKSVLSDDVEFRREREGGVDRLDVTFNGKITEPLVFDTGASLTTISSALAARIGLNPKPSDKRIQIKVADGSVFTATLMTIPSMRVGKFTVNNVPCAVMPPDKTDMDALLGQSFLRNFTYKLTPGTGRLHLARVETGETAAKPARTSNKKTKARRAYKNSTGSGASDGFFGNDPER
jgi:aspartyl protease family protein